jgi:hypothetical protein
MGITRMLPFGLLKDRQSLVSFSGRGAAVLAFVEEKPRWLSGEPFGSKKLLAHCLLCSL